MLYDLSLPVSPALVTWPGDPQITCDALGETVKISRWTLGSHSGTHVDAPAHFSAGPRTVDLLDPEVLLGPCRVLDVGEAPSVTAELLRGCALQGVTRLLLRTRNSRHGQEDLTTFHPDFVALAADAARLLVEHGVRLVGIDALSIEAYDGDGTVHDTLLGAEVIVVEGLHLAAVPAGDYELICAPLRLQGADGAPARVWLRG